MVSTISSNNFAESEKKLFASQSSSITGRTVSFGGSSSSEEMRKLDFKMAEAAGIMNPANKQVIENYWEMVKRIGLKFHENSLSKFSDLINIPKREPDDEKRTCPEAYIRLLKQYAENAKKAHTNYLEKLKYPTNNQRKLLPEKTQIQDDYLTLFALFNGKAFVNEQIGKFAEDLYREYQHFVEHMHKTWVVQKVEKDIKKAKELIKLGEQEIDDIEQRMGLFAGVDEESGKKLIASIVVVLADLEASLKEWEDAQKDTLSYAYYRLFGDSDLIRQAVKDVVIDIGTGSA